MINKVLLFLIFNLSSLLLNATTITPEQLQFDFLSSEGSFWHDCTHKKLEEPHQFLVSCPDQKNTFKVHLLLKEYFNPLETTYELHYWADYSNSSNKQTSTQSTWLTVEKGTPVKKIVGYLGFDTDATQFRFELNIQPLKK